MWLYENCRFFKNYPQGTLLSNTKAEFEGKYKTRNTGNMTPGVQHGIHTVAASFVMQTVQTM